MGCHTWWTQIGLNQDGKAVFENLDTKERAVEEDHEFLRELRDDDAVIEYPAETQPAH
jgi:hypothetical protein